MSAPKGQLEGGVTLVGYVGLAVSKEATAFCVMDEAGRVLARAKAASDPQALFEALKEHCPCPERMVMETGTLSHWLVRGLRARAHLAGRRRDMENTIRGLLASMGCCFPKGVGRFAARVAAIPHRWLQGEPKFAIAPDTLGAEAKGHHDGASRARRRRRLRRQPCTRRRQKARKCLTEEPELDNQPPLRMRVVCPPETPD